MRSKPDDKRNGKAIQRVMLLMKSSTYRAPDFLQAAEQLNAAVQVIKVIDAPEALAQQRADLITADFRELQVATQTIVSYAQQRGVDAILAVDDSGALLAAEAASALGLPHNDPAAAEAARDKYRMRQLMAQRGVPVPGFRRFSTADDVTQITAQAAYPCVVKPLRLSGSQGVMRADNPDELKGTVTRLTKMLQDMAGSDGEHFFLVEDYIPGVEVALEGMLDNGQLHVLALFDKPDPLVGPFFEETIYVTPSRLPQDIQERIAQHTTQAAKALGLQRGPVHAELRVNNEGPWLLEIAGRSIGGLCSRTLRFGVDTSLETLILQQALGMEMSDLGREPDARGVMMIPIPKGGLLRGYSGLEEAQAVPHVTEVEITAPLNHTLTPLPEGDSYLGFVFARAATPDEVETALREAHARLHFEIEPVIPLRMGPLH